MEFRAEICRMAKGASPILEVGPSYNPILPKADGYSVKTVDHATQSKLKEKYSAFGVDVSKIEPVDYVTTDIGSLASHGIRYKIILASHVVEHTADFVKFINDCESILDDDGVVILLVPDKRFCFDVFRPLSTAGAMIDAHLSKRARHYGSVFDHYAFFTLRNGSMAWGREEVGAEYQIHSPEQTVESFNKTLSTSDYVDAHEWVFTPSSFELIIQDLVDCNMINLKVSSCHDSVGYEFLCILSRGSERERVSRSSLLHAIRVEELTASLSSFSESDFEDFITLNRPGFFFKCQQKVNEVYSKNEELILANSSLQSANELLNITSENLQSANKLLHFANENLRSKNDRAEKLINSLYCSTSWRLTHPVRKAKALFSSMFRNR